MDEDGTKPRRHDVKRLLRLAWPLIIARATQVIIGLSDAAMCGRLGQHALAASTSGALNVYTLYILPVGIAMAVNTFAAQYHGRSEPKMAWRYAWCGIWLGAAAQCVGMGAAAALPRVAPYLPYDAAVRDLVVSYVSIRLLCVGAVVGLESLNGYFGAINQPQRAMQAGVLAMVLNVGLNFWLIFGGAGISPLGVAGAAWASNIATWGALAYSLVIFWQRRPVSPGRLQGAATWKLLRVGLPLGINLLCDVGAFTVFVNVVIAPMGTTALAAVMSVMQLNTLAFMPTFALASAGAIMAGQALGATQIDRAKEIAVRTLGAAGVWLSFAACIGLLWPETLLRLFVGDSHLGDGFTTIGVPIVRLCAVWLLFDGVTITLAEFMRAAGDTVVPMAARIGLAWLVFLPAAWFVTRYGQGGPTAAMGTQLVYMGLLAMAMVGRYRGGNWQRRPLLASLREAH